MKTSKTKIAIFGLLFASGLNLYAVTSLNLTAGGSGTLNGALFVTTDQQPTGSGVIQSFVRLSQSGNNTTAEGYNSSSSSLMPDVNTSNTFTHDIQLSSLSLVNIAGVSYYQFLLDINQNNNDPLLSLDELQIYTRSTALTDASTLANLQAAPSQLRYDLDGAGDAEILLNYNLNSGSGSGDLYAYIPQTAFSGAAGTDFVYLYSMFGAKGGAYAENDGFEEWATVSSNGVPDGGGTLVLLGSALTCIGAVRRLATKR
jgi:hypothetical protein